MVKFTDWRKVGDAWEVEVSVMERGLVKATITMVVNDIRTPGEVRTWPGWR